MLLSVIMILPILPLIGFATGSVDPIVGARSLAISPNGEQLAFSYRGDLWVSPSSGGLAVPISTNVELEDYPVWSRDGKQIAFSSNRNGGVDIYVVGVNGGTPKRLTYHSGSDVPSDWSIDNKKILFRATRDRSENGIFELDVETGKFKAVFYDQMSIGNPKYSRMDRRSFTPATVFLGSGLATTVRPHPSFGFMTFRLASEPSSATTSSSTCGQTGPRTVSPLSR